MKVDLKLKLLYAGSNFNDCEQKKIRKIIKLDI